VSLSDVDINIGERAYILPVLMNHRLELF
jgi:hypothetical protein